MTKILDKVRAISSDAIAKKQDAAKNKMPEIYKQIEGAAGLGKTSCEFAEYMIDEYSQKLLKADGFNCYITTKIPDYSKYDSKGYDYIYRKEPVSIWIVSW